MQLSAQSSGELRSKHPPFNGVKVFSTTIFTDCARLDDEVAAWLATRPEIRVTQLVVTQSSDAAYQCIAVTVFYWEPVGS
jgi:hypothetical protein